MMRLHYRQPQDVSTSMYLGQIPDRAPPPPPKHPIKWESLTLHSKENEVLAAVTSQYT